jgi:hypothetical protein
VLEVERHVVAFWNEVALEHHVFSRHFERVGNDGLYPEALVDHLREALYLGNGLQANLVIQGRESCVLCARSGGRGNAGLDSEVFVEHC